MTGGRTRVVAAALTVMALATTGACSSGDNNGGAGESSTPVASATPGAGPACTDEVGDSAPVLDLLSVQLVRTGKRVRVIVEQNTRPPTENTVEWTVGFVSADGDRYVDLTTKLAQGTQTSHAITVDDDRRQPQTDPVRITPTGMTTTFPVDPIDDLGPGTRWYAVLTVNGNDIDFCPGGSAVIDLLDIVPLDLPTQW
ncbi:MAG: hypothetical protein ACT4P1_15355 [Sporichthyaceae bacterium]